MVGWQQCAESGVWCREAFSPPAAGWLLAAPHAVFLKRISNWAWFIKPGNGKHSKDRSEHSGWGPLTSIVGNVLDWLAQMFGVELMLWVDASGDLLHSVWGDNVHWLFRYYFQICAKTCPVRGVQHIVALWKRPLLSSKSELMEQTMWCVHSEITHINTSIDAFCLVHQSVIWNIKIDWLQPLIKPKSIAPFIIVSVRASQ